MDSTIIECTICLQSPKQAVETQCCGQIFCETCLTGVENKICPSCRAENVKFYPNRSLRKLLESQETECPNKCGMKFNLTELMKHVKICKKNRVECPAPNCQLKFDKDQDFLKHLIKDHEKETLEKSHLLFKDLFVPLCLKQGYDPSEPVVNEAGRRSMMGENGKFYCGGARVSCLQGFPYRATHNHMADCTLCGGRCCYSSYSSSTCGPNSGCNCEPCQKLDLHYRGIAEKGWLVNTNGALCKFIPAKGITKFYEGEFICGRRAMEGDKNLTLYCGHTAGKVCQWCDDMRKHTQYGGLYKSFLHNPSAA